MENKSRSDMVAYISDALVGADDYTVQQVYEFLLEAEYS